MQVHTLLLVHESVLRRPKADEYDEDEFIVEKKAPEPPKITVLGCAQLFL